jgi:hypothetical protein
MGGTCRIRNVQYYVFVSWKTRTDRVANVGRRAVKDFLGGYFGDKG